MLADLGHALRRGGFIRAIGAGHLRGAARFPIWIVALLLLVIGSTTSIDSAHADRRRADAPGPRVACLGDSNTNSSLLAESDQWCEKLRSGHGFRTKNFGVGGATALPNNLEFYFGSVEAGWYGQTQLDAALDWGADYYVFAYITNDVQLSGKPLLFGAVATEETADELALLVADAEATGKRAFVLMGPPVFEPGKVELNPEIDAINAQLGSIMPDVFVEDSLDFTADEMLSDGLHLGPMGHDRRARAVASAIATVVPEPAEITLLLAALLSVAALWRYRSWAASPTG